MPVESGIQRLTIVSDSKAAILIMVEACFHQSHSSDKLQNLILRENILFDSFKTIFECSKKFKQLAVIHQSSHGMIFDSYSQLNSMADSVAKAHAQAAIRELLPSNIVDPRFTVITSELQLESEEDLGAVPSWIRNTTTIVTDDESVGHPDQ